MNMPMPWLQDSESLWNLQEKLFLKSLYHLHCVSLEIVLSNCICEDCEASGTSEGQSDDDDDEILPYMDMCLIT